MPATARAASQRADARTGQCPAPAHPADGLVRTLDKGPLQESLFTTQARREREPKLTARQKSDLRMLREQLPRELVARLRAYHDVLRTPMSGEQVEEMISDALDEIGCPNEWLPGSHQVSTDITLASLITTSVKRGKTSDTLLKISSSRLGSHSHCLDAMLEHVKQTSAQYYVCLPRPEKSWKILPRRDQDKVYHYTVFPSSLIDLGSKAEWVHSQGKDGKGKSTWEYTPMESGLLVRAKIVESMSYQLWLDLDLSRLDMMELTIPARVK